LAEELGCFHLDTDDFYWEKTDVPYTEVVPVDQRVERILSVLSGHDSWVISGCMCSWGDEVLAAMTHVVYQWEEWSVRKQRLIEREERRFGKESFQAGGEREHLFNDFIEWAEQYDKAGVNMRSRVRHEAWLDEFSSSVNLTRFENMPNVSAKAKRTIYLDALASEVV